VAPGADSAARIGRGLVTLCRGPGRRRKRAQRVIEGVASAMTAKPLRLEPSLGHGEMTLRGLVVRTTGIVGPLHRAPLRARARPRPRRRRHRPVPHRQPPSLRRRHARARRARRALRRRPAGERDRAGTQSSRAPFVGTVMRRSHGGTRRTARPRARIQLFITACVSRGAACARAPAPRSATVGGGSGSCGRMRPFSTFSTACVGNPAFAGGKSGVSRARVRCHTGWRTTTSAGPTAHSAADPRSAALTTSPARTASRAPCAGARRRADA
jgi:hypothetical protein